MHPSIKSDLISLANDFTDKWFKQSMEIGKTLQRPDGRTVKIKSGCFRDAKYSRISNWWIWNEVLSDGTMGSDESGYGW